MGELVEVSTDLLAGDTDAPDAAGSVVLATRKEATGGDAELEVDVDASVVAGVEVAGGSDGNGELTSSAGGKWVAGELVVSNGLELTISGDSELEFEFDATENWLSSCGLAEDGVIVVLVAVEAGGCELAGA